MLPAMSDEIHVESTSKKRFTGVFYEETVFYAEVNAFLRTHEGAKVFGQQN